MGHMKKSWGKTIKTILGVLVGNLVLSFAVAAFTVPNGIIMGGATGIGLGNQCGVVRSRCSISWKEVCIDNDHQFFYLSNIPVDGTVHSGNRQSDGE